jgi:UDP-N-acetylglucosamine acyltransferase
MTNSTIHPTALIAPEAEIGEGVEIGAYAVIESGVQVGDGCRILGHAQILSGVRLGENCVVGHGAVIGGEPQDFKFSREIRSGVEIGAGTILREHVTVHRGSREGSMTRLGVDNFLMAGSHVGHNVQMGDNNVLANQCLLGGEVQIGTRNFLGGGSAFHQFVRVGDLCMVKGLTAISQDVPPFVMVSGSNQIRGLNVVGMSRAGFCKEQRQGVKAAFHHIYRAGLNLSQALEAAKELEWLEEGHQFIDFFRNASAKGVCRLDR